jgi:hypothetical protein
LFTGAIDSFACTFSDLVFAVEALFASFICWGFGGFAVAKDSTKEVGLGFMVLISPEVCKF